MRWIVGSSLRLSVFVLVVAAVITVAGIVGLTRAPVDTLPEFMPPTVQVQTEALGLSALEVEQFITVPFEDEFNGLAFLDHIRSQSLPGLSAVDLTFKPGTNIYTARQLVTERVAQGPAVVNVGSPPVIIQPLSAENRVMMIALSSKTMSPIDLSTLALWRIRPRLLAVPGVANVAIWGQRDKQLQVLIDPARMTARRISLEQVINTAGNALWASPLTFVEASSPGADGLIDTPNQRLSVQHILPIRTAKDLASVPIEDNPGPPVHLGDVATVVEGHPLLRGDAVLSDGPGFLLVVSKFPGTNTLALTRDLDAALADLKPGLAGVTVDATILRPATFIQTALGNVGIAGLAAFVLLVAWLGLSSRSWRVALIGGVAVAMSVIAAAYALLALGTTFNVMTLAGLVIALGVVVDDAVVGALTIKRRLAARRRAEPDAPADRATLAVAVTEALIEARRPLVYAFVIVLLGVLPLLFLDGVAGSFARPMVTAYALAVIVSTLVALVVTPVLAYVLLPSAPPDRRSSAPASWIERAFDRAAPRFFSRPAWVFGAIVVIAVIALAALALLRPGPSIPPMQDRDLLVQWQAAPGTSLDEMERITRMAGGTMREIPGVRGVASHVGQALTGDQIVNVDAAETWISLDPKADYGATVAAIQRKIDAYPGIGHRLLTYPQASLDAARTGNGKAVTVRLYGTGDQLLRSEAQDIRQSLSTVEGIENLSVQPSIDEPSIQIETKDAAAARYGLKPGDIRRQTAVLMAGIAVGAYYHEQQIFDVTVWSEPKVRRNLTDVGNLLLDTPAGPRVRLKQVASVSVRPTPARIDHDRVSRFVDVTADVSEGGLRSLFGLGANLEEVLGQVSQSVQSLELPLGYHAEVTSDLADRQGATTRVLLYVLAAVVAAFLLLQAAFRSWVRAALLFFTLLLAASGGLVAALATGRPLSVGALIGFVVVIGIALRNGILLIQRFQRLEESGKAPADDAPRDGLVLKASREAAFEVVVTAVAVVLVLLPFFVRGPVAGMEILEPLGLVVLGGLVTSTFVTLFVLPALYARFVGTPVKAEGATEPEGAGR